MSNSTSAWDKARGLVEILKTKGYSAYFAGGAVRDLLLGATSSNADIDIATSATPEQVMELFPESFAVGAAFGVVNVLVDGTPFEVATYRSERGYADGRHPDEVSYSDSPEIDALRRDFTINAMFLDPISGEVRDFVGGKEDLDRGIIRAVGNPSERIAEDYLRILRAVRFANRFDFKMDDGVTAAICANVKGLNSLSKERVRDELSKMLTGPRPGQALRSLADIGALAVAIPEVDAFRGIPQPKQYHPEGDVFEHTVLALDAVAAPDMETMWAVLLHDVGKPDTLRIGDDGVERFHGHDCLGAEIADGILRRFKFPNKTRETVVAAVSGHMRLAHSPKMREAKLRRLLAAPSFPVELELHRVDCASSHRKFDIYAFLLDKLAEVSNQTKLPPPLLNGREIIAMGVQEGPDVGKIMATLTDMTLEGAISSKNDAKNAILSILRNKSTD